MSNEIKKAVQILESGGLIIYPTDTAFGIGCRIDFNESVERLFKVRRRPRDQAVPVLVASLAMALPYFANPSDVVRRLMEKYWPGALTIVQPGNVNLVNPLIRGGRTNIGIRMPSYHKLIQIISSVGVPILGPSANFHGEKTPYSKSMLDPKLVKLVDYVLPGECNNSGVSTVVDCSVSPYVIIRKGILDIPPEGELKMR